MDLQELKIDKRNYEEGIEELEYVLSHKDLFEKKSGGIKTRLKLSENLQNKMKRAFSLESFFDVCEDSLRIFKIELKYINDSIEKLSDSFFTKADNFEKYLNTLFNNVSSEKYTFLEVQFVIDHFILMRLNKNYFNVNLNYGDIEGIDDLKNLNKNIQILIDNADNIKEIITKEFKIKDIKL